MKTRALRIIAACLLTLLLGAVIARADGDPASDTLLGESVFYPYSPPVSHPLEQTLNAETAAASREHFPIKVALIASPLDLGVIPALFNHPQKYADFLEQEITFQGKPRLLVVMPTGYGVQGLPQPSIAAAQSLTKPAGNRADDLARAAITAVPKLAAAAGHPIKAAPHGASTGRGSRTLIVVILVVAAVATAAVLVIARRRAQTG